MLGVSFVGPMLLYLVLKGFRFLTLTKKFNELQPIQKFTRKTGDGIARGRWYPYVIYGILEPIKIAVHQRRVDCPSFHKRNEIVSLGEIVLL